jgi:choline dehydrogenase-like flavoprotein
VVKSGATGPVLADMLAKALRRIPNLNMGRPAIYMNRDSLDAFDLQSNNMPLLQFKTQEEAQGKFVTRFRGVPIRRVDQILSNEAGI